MRLQKSEFNGGVSGFSLKAQYLSQDLYRSLGRRFLGFRTSGLSFKAESSGMELYNIVSRMAVNHIFKHVSFKVFEYRV